MPSIIQSSVIDVTAWPVDYIFETYPEGARSKTAYFPPTRLPFAFLKPKRRYLYKRSRKRYPDQFWGEIVAYLVGGLLDVPVPPAYAAINTEDGDCGALIEWFYEDGKAQFVAGGQYMQQLIPDYDRKKGKQHNFRSVRILAEAFELSHLADASWREWWCNALVFDALIGNTDRHQDNWGYLSYAWRDGRVREVRLAPLFDNGTSLGHELYTDLIQNWDIRRYSDYVNRGTHHIKWKVGDQDHYKHADLVKLIKAEFPEDFKRIQLKLEEFDVRELEGQLQRLCELEISVPLTQARKNLYIELVSIRRERLLKALR
jgi:HipA-like C-terminal domain